jgi:TonB family protein
MNSIALESLHWNWRRWVMFFVLIFATQLLLIYFLSANNRAPSRREIQHVAVEVFPKQLTESEFTETFLASDPTLFVLPNRHGFSGSAWLKVPSRNYDLVEQTKPSFWLGLDSEQLGTTVGQFIRTNILSTLQTSENPTPEIFVSQMPDALAYAKTNSTFRFEGNLAARKLNHLPKLESQHHTDILSNSVVQIAVDKSGAVISTRLISRSGKNDSDRSALETARQLQFAPGKEIVWGNLIFDWHTIPVASTNSAVKTSAP